MKASGSQRGWCLGNSTYVTKILVDDFSIAMKNTGGDASWPNGNN